MLFSNNGIGVVGAVVKQLHEKNHQELNFHTKNLNLVNSQKNKTKFSRVLGWNFLLP